jgi:hypothetical protein
MKKYKSGSIIFRRIGGRIIPFIKDRKSIIYSLELEKRYIQKTKKIGYGFAKEYHEHHTLPVAESIEHIDWHLRNLWEGGWKTIKTVSKAEHYKSHKNISKKTKIIKNMLKKMKKKR